MSSLNCDDTASIVTTSGIMSSKFRNLRLLDKVLLSVIVVLSIIVLALIISVGVQGSKLRYLELQEASPLRETTVKSGTVRPGETTTPPPTPTPKGPAPPRPMTSPPHTAKPPHPPHPPHPEPCIEPECVNVCLDPECVETAGGMLKTMAKHANPCDDFYEYACGQWGDVNLIPDSAYSWNQFEMSRELVSRAVNELLMHDHEIELRPEPLQDAKKFYDDCIHQNNENNYTQLKEFIEHMLVDFHKDLGTTLGRLRRNLGANYLFTLKVDTNSKDTSKNTIFLDQPDFAIPRSILTSNNYMHDNEVHSYSALIIESWGAVFGVSHTAAAEVAANVLHFERSLALATTAPVHRMNQSELHNVYTIEELYVLTESEGKHLSWDDFFEEVFAEIYDPVSHGSSWNKTTVIVRDVHFFHMIENILNSNDTAHILHDYLAWRIIYEMIQDVSEELRDFYFNFELATQEMESPLPMWRMCAGQTQHHFGMALTYYFVEEYFDEDLKFLVQEIVDEIKKTLKSALMGTSSLQWISKTTRSKVIAKLEGLKVHIGHPDWLTNPANSSMSFTTGLHEYYYHLQLDKDNNHFENVVEMLEWRSKEELKDLTKSNTYEKWVFDPLDVSVYYWPKHNSLTISAGIIQQPFFFGHSLQYLNFGAIGSVIGHSLVHVFDNRGRQFKADGSTGNIWDAETEAGYRTSLTCFESEFHNYTAEDQNIVIPWKQSLSDESIADNIGLKLAYKAYQAFTSRHGEEKLLPGLHHTQDQLFFLAHAQMWCETTRRKYSPEDSSLPPQFQSRSGFLNSAEFEEAWQCKNSPALKPCRIW